MIPGPSIRKLSLAHSVRGLCAEGSNAQPHPAQLILTLNGACTAKRQASRRSRKLPLRAACD